MSPDDAQKKVGVHLDTPFFIAVEKMQKNKKKIVPCLDYLVQYFEAAYYPSKELSIGEMVIGFHGRWKNKQFIASKPAKYHIKTFG